MQMRLETVRTQIDSANQGRGEGESRVNDCQDREQVLHGRLG